MFRLRKAAHHLKSNLLLCGLINMADICTMDRPSFKTIVIFVLLFVSDGLHAQDLDSIEQSMGHETHDSTRLKNLLVLAKGYSFEEYDKALKYGKQAAALASELEDKKNLAWAYNYIGSTFYYRGDYDSALIYHQQALGIRQQVQDKKGLGASYNNIGNIYNDRGETAKALDYYLRALKYFDESGFKMGTGIVYNSIGNLYYLQKKYDLSLEYFQKSAALQQELGNRIELMHSYNNIAIIYDEKKDYTSALAYYNRSLQVAQEVGNTSSEVTTLGNMGQLYMSLGEYKQAESLLRKAIALGDRLEDKAKLVVPHINLGTLFMNQEQYDSAQVSFQRSLDLSKEMGIKPYIKEAYHYLAEVSYHKGDLESTYRYHTLYDDIKDSLYNEESSRQVAEMQTKYDTEQKEQKLKMNAQQIELLEKDKALQRTVKNFIIGFLLAVLVFAFFLYRAYRGMRKLNIVLATQKMEILNKNHDLQDKNVLIERQKQEITDSINYARNIQQAVLPRQEHIHSLLPQSFVMYRPKDIVSGDFYWFREKENEVFFAAADSTGHGVPGGFMSMIGTEKLNDALKQTRDPGMLLQLLNRSIKDALHQDAGDSIKDGMDIALCSLRKNVLQYAGANRPLFIVRDGANEVEEVKPDKIAIGGYTDDSQKFITHTIPLQSNDMIYLFSDGYVDQFGGPDGKKFMTKRFKELIISIAKLSPSMQQQALEKNIREWMRDIEQVDDMMVIGIRV